MTRTLTKADSRVPVALCWHYFSAHVEELRVQVLAANGTPSDLTATWALGVRADGDWESLGAWPGAAVGPAFWRSVWEDLDGRGVDRISLVCAADRDARVLCPGVKVLSPLRWGLGQVSVPAASGVGVLRAEARRVVRDASGVRPARLSLERLLADSGAGRAALSPDWLVWLEQFRAFYALRPHRRAVVRAGDEYLEQLGLSLSRAVRRHGPFVDLAAAVSFVAQTISRDELRLKFSKLPKATRPALHLVGPDAAGLAPPSQ
ncbi:transposase [Paucibacter sp. JuS9]|uniref:transposase n=1 Tax=Paucibacter sp. JuS9 TaxID=3228748 RepID=UPI0037571A7F